MKKLKINNLTILFVFFSLIGGFIKDTLLIFFIVLFHELGHLFFSKIFGYKIISISLYPFGGIIKYESLINSNTYKDFLIYFGGIIFQLILFLVFLLFFEMGFLSLYTYKLFLSYNFSIMIFNLIPIIPLDGYLILNYIFNVFLSFKKSYKLSFIISFVFIILFLILNYCLKINNYLIVALFIYKMVLYYKNFKFIQEKFLLERYLYKFDYKYSDRFLGVNLDYLRKNHQAKFYFDNKWVDEYTILAKKFDNRE